MNDPENRDEELKRMKRIASRVLVPAAAAAAMFGLAGGVAHAAPEAQAAPVAQGVPVWVLPGLDLGSVLDPSVALPAQALAPVVGLVSLVGA
jgi:hypothetical protein